MSRTGHLPEAVSKEEEKQEKGSLLDGLDPAVEIVTYSLNPSSERRPVNPAAAGAAEGAAQEVASSLLDKVADNVLGSILDGI